ncbi:MAG: FAD-binding oxidoreductase [Hyphomicrobiales bacterium]|nr:FAD-binding oxidoreductase [Hyphomicrobiales bacterium]
MSSEDYPDSFYARTLRERRAYPSLEEDLDIETLVIGGGLAGCATALDLAEHGHSVALVEARRIGWGASGRNGGFVSDGFPGGYPALVDRVGLERARELHKLARLGNLLLRERIERYNIACGPVQDGALRCNMAGQSKSLAEFCDFMARNFDAHYTHWPRERVHEALSTDRYADALFNPHTYAVQPLDLTCGLARACGDKGATVFEDTPVISLTSYGDRKEVRTARGRIRADRLVITCGGYVNGLQKTISDATVPIATFVMVTEPLGERLKKAIRVPYAISDIKVATNYYRPLADTRLLWGGRVLAWERSPADVARLLKRDMVSFYPDLSEARIEVAWGGMMPFTRHKLPVIGEIEPGIWFATGFGGLGLALTTTAGRLISGAIREADCTWRLFAEFGLPYAGGKLGKIPAQLVYWRHQLGAKFGFSQSA